MRLYIDLQKMPQTGQEITYSDNGIFTTRQANDMAIKNLWFGPVAISDSSKENLGLNNNKK